MELYLSVDCGGTKADCVFFDSEGKVIKEIRVSGGTNRRTLPAEQVEENIKKCLYEVKKELGENRLLGIYGYFMHCEELFEKYGGEILGCDKVYPIEEGTLALYCAGIYPDGVVLLSGTGADAFVVKDGVTVDIIGGYGAFLGDNGSGYHMGREGVNAACAAYEQRGESTVLLDMLREKYPAETFRKSVYALIGAKEPVKEIAAFSHEVEKAADMGDKVAIQIFGKVAKALSEFVTAAYKKNGLPDDFPLTVTGGILRSDCEREKPILIPQIERLCGKKIVSPGKKPSHGGIACYLFNGVDGN